MAFGRLQTVPPAAPDANKALVINYGGIQPSLACLIQDHYCLMSLTAFGAELLFIILTLDRSISVPHKGSGVGLYQACHMAE